MRFGGLVAIDDLSLHRPPARDHRDHRPERRRQDHGVQLPDRLLQADGRAAHLPRPTARPAARADGRVSRSPRAGLARTFQNIRLFGQMSVLENLIVAQHNRLMRASGYTRPRAARRRQLSRSRAGGGRARPRSGSSASAWSTAADWNAGNLPYGDQRKLEIARAMCTGPEAALPRRAGGRPQPARDRRARPAAARHPRRVRHRRSC